MKTQMRRIIAILLAFMLLMGVGVQSYGAEINASDADSTPAVEEQKTPEPAKEEPKEEPKAEQPEAQAPESEEATTPETQGEEATDVAEDPAAVVDENAEAEQEVIEDEVKMPAQSFSGSAGGINVSVNAPEGAFPEGTKMSVRGVSSASAMGMLEGTVDGVVDAKGVDFTFTHKGKEVEPEKKVSVKFSGANLDGDEFNIYHVADNGAVEKVSTNATANGGSFKADEFSIYIVEGQVWKKIDGQTITLGVGETKTLYITDRPIPKLTVNSSNGEIKIDQKTGSRSVEITGVKPTPGNSTVKVTNGGTGNALFEVKVTGTATTYTVKYDLDGGSTTSTQTEFNNLVYGVATPTIDEPTKTGCIFKGWQPAVSNTVTGNVTYTAQWEQEKYTVKYDLKGGSTTSQQTEFKNLVYGDKTPTIDEPTKAGYDFKGWQPAVSNTVTGNATYTAQWQKATYTVTYNLDGGSTTSSKTVFNNLNYGDRTPKINDPTKTGFIFKGWQPAVKSTVTGNVTYTAQWEQEKYTVKYDLKGGSTTSQQTEFNNLVYGVATPTIDEPTKTGCIFKGWQPAVSNTVTGNATYTAQWEQAVTVTYTVDGIGGTVSPTTNTITKNSAANVTGSTATADAGYEFVGWYVNGVKLSGIDENLSASVARICLNRNWKFEYQDTIFVAKFKETKKAVTVTIVGNTATKVYNGSEQEVTGYTITDISDPNYTANDFTFNGQAIAKGTDVNTYPMGLKAEDFVNNNNNYKAQFNVTDGKLIITPSDEMTLDATGYEGRYDGNTHSGTVTPSVTKGTTLSYSTNGGKTWSKTAPTIKDVGTINVTVKAENPNYKTKTATYTLKVNKRLVILTSGSDTKEFDGLPLMKAGVTVGGEGFVASEAKYWTYSAVGEVVFGETANTIVYANDPFNTKPSNYEIRLNEGTLKVVARKVVVQANSKETLYNGQPQKVEGITGDHFSIYGVPFTVKGLSASLEKTDAGEYTVEVKGTPKVVNFFNVDCTKYFDVETKSGKLVINKRTVTLTSATDQKEYDGDPLTNDTVTVGGDGFAAGEGATYDVTGTQTEVGSSKNTFSYILNANTKAGNYTITQTDGDLTVTPYTGLVTVTAVGGTYTYDGQAHEAKIKVTGLPKGYHVDIAKSNEEATHVAEGAITANCDRLVVKNAAGDVVYDYNSEEEFDPGYVEDPGYRDPGYEPIVVSAGVKAAANTNNLLNVVFNSGSIKINPAPVKVTTDSATKTYDGTALKAKAHMKGLVNGETATVKATGSRTEVGSSKNTYKITWETAQQNDYAVTDKLGTLTVNGVPAPAPAAAVTPTDGPADGQQTVNAEDGQTPLANNQNDECCILHFLLMLAALIVLIAYTSSMKKRQEEIFELKKQLENKGVEL